MVDKPKETPSYTKPVGKPGDERVRPEKSDYSKFSRENQTPYKETAVGQGYKNVGNAAKGTPSKGSERVRPGGDKADYAKYTKEEPFKETATGQGYKNVGSKAKKTPSLGAERTEGAYKKKSPWRNV